MATSHKESKFKNGDIVKDSTSKFQGMIIGTTLWLHGCFRYVVSSKGLNKDGIPAEASFDENQLELVKAKNHVANRETGGPYPMPNRR